MPTGHYPRPRPSRVDRGHCEWCGTPFERVRSQTSNHTRFCRKACLVKWLHQFRRVFKTPEELETLRRMYWDERKTGVQIAKALGKKNHKSVIDALHASGVGTRGRAKPVPLTCSEPGCQEPPRRIWHKRLQVFYGMKCKEHLRLYKNAKARYMKSSDYPKISEEERWLRKGKETLIITKKLCRAQSR